MMHHMTPNLKGLPRSNFPRLQKFPPNFRAHLLNSYPHVGSGTNPIPKITFPRTNLVRIPRKSQLFPIQPNSIQLHSNLHSNSPPITADTSLTCFPVPFDINVSLLPLYCENFSLGDSILTLFHNIFPTQPNPTQFHPIQLQLGLQLTTNYRRYVPHLLP